MRPFLTVTAFICSNVSVPVRGMRDLYDLSGADLTGANLSFRPRQGNEGFV